MKRHHLEVKSQVSKLEVMFSDLCFRVFFFFFNTYIFNVFVYFVCMFGRYAHGGQKRLLDLMGLK